VTIEHLRDEARQVAAKIGLLRDIGKPLVVEVGSNDGSFLKQLRDIGLGPESLIGVDPARAMAARANQDGIQTMNDFFDEDVAASIVKHRGRAHLVVANNVLAHVPDVLATLRAVRLLLADDGVLVMEVAHAVDVIQGAFDTIYHEHMSHHALLPLSLAFNELDMRIIDVEKSAGQVGRGSLRVYATPRGSKRWPDNATAARYVKMLEDEQATGVLDASRWTKSIGSHVDKTELELQLFIDEHDKGIIAGYGAPAKLTTLAHACSLGDAAIDYVIDDSPWKQNLFTPGLGWPIVTSDEIKKRPPAAVVMFAWNFADDVARKLRVGGYTGPIAVPLPEWRVL
jgi:SAM-dependent methyltransferase